MLRSRTDPCRARSVRGRLRAARETLMNSAVFGAPGHRNLR